MKRKRYNAWRWLVTQMNASNHKILHGESFNPFDCIISSPSTHTHSLLNDNNVDYYYYREFFFPLHKFNNYCNILSPEEFNRRTVSFEALYTHGLRRTHPMYHDKQHEDHAYTDIHTVTCSHRRWHCIARFVIVVVSGLLLLLLLLG